MREEVRPGRREGVGWRRRNRHVHGEGLTQAGGVRARAERTLNIQPMFVTLDVSKLSAWLNADAPCRVERRACDAGKRYGPGGVRALGGGDAIGVHGEGPTRGCVGAGHARSARRTWCSWL